MSLCGYFVFLQNRAMGRTSPPDTQAGTARSQSVGPCLGRRPGTRAAEARHGRHVGQIGTARYSPCLAQARAGPTRPGPVAIYTSTLASCPMAPSGRPLEPRALDETEPRGSWLCKTLANGPNWASTRSCIQVLNNWAIFRPRLISLLNFS